MIFPSLGLGLYRIWPDNLMAQYDPLPASKPDTKGNIGLLARSQRQLYDYINNYLDDLRWFYNYKPNYKFDFACQTYWCLVGNVGIIQSITIIIQSSNPPFPYV